MDLDSITVEDFKTLFKRDFAYLPVYDDEKLYNQGNRVYYPDTELFYDCLQNGTTGELPTEIDYWVQVADDTLNYIGDDDIEKAFSETKVNFNQSLFGDDDSIELGYLYMAAHFLVNDLKASMGGINASAAFPLSSRTVGNVSESYDIPQAYKDDPLLSFYTQSAYGLKFLSMVLPKIRGNVGVVCGRTLP